MISFRGQGDSPCAAPPRRILRPRRRPGRAQPARPSLRERHLGIVRIEAPVPQLAGHLLVPLVEALAVVRELAAADEVAVAQPDLAEPVGIGEASGARPRRCRPRRAPGCPPPDRRSTCRRSSRPGPGGPPRGGPPGSPRPAARCGRTGRARRRSRSACTRSPTRRCTDRPPRRPWAAWRPRTGRPWTPTGSRPGRGEAQPEPDRVVDVVAALDHVVAEVADADHVVGADRAAAPSGAPRAAAARAPGARRRSRRPRVQSARGTRPSCRRARSGARRRRSPPRARGARPSAKRPGRTRGRSRMCGRWRSLTRSR